MPPSITGLVVMVEVINVVTSNLPSGELENITNVAANAFNVSSDAINTYISYVASGSLKLDFPEAVEEASVVEAVTQSLSSLLDIHESAVTVTSVDMDTGIIEYEVAFDNYATASAVQTTLDEFGDDTVEEAIQQSLPNTNVDSSDVNGNIVVDITLVLDGSDTESIGVAKNLVTETLQSDGYSVSSQVSIVTSSPSMLPTMTTFLPSASPSVSGIVVTITLSSAGSLSKEELDNVESEIASDFDVDAGDVVAEAVYTISGTMVVSEIDDAIAEEELTNIVKESIADSLGVHISSVNVDIDRTTGEFAFTVTVDDIDLANETQDKLSSNDFLLTVESEMSSSLPTEVRVTTIAVDEDVLMNVVVTIDASESPRDVSEVSTKVVERYESNGFEVSSDSTRIDFYDNCI